MRQSGNSDYDVLIIGGGPAGSTAACTLAKAGRRVAVFEKEKFPRFHIGESLLPYNRPLFTELGLLKKLDDPKKFVRKNGARIGLWDGSRSVRFAFANGRFTEEESAFQVERAEFDELLLDHAREAGANVFQEHSVQSFEVTPDAVETKVRNARSGGIKSFRGRFLIDASGTHNFTGNRMKLRRPHPNLQKIAVYTHFDNVDRRSGDEAGDIEIYRHPEAWFWLIPLSKSRASVGVVFDREKLRATGSDAKPETLFETYIKDSPALQSRLKNAGKIMPLKSMVDFSYSNERYVSERLVRVGDAAGFLDPIFSSGVYLAMLSARNGALAVDKSIENGALIGKPLKRYEREARRHMGAYRQLIEGFYRPEFVELLLQPKERLGLPCGINALLAGRLDAYWSVRWRILVFLILVRIQGHVPLVKHLGLR